MKKIDSIVLSGKESLPLIEGGKGIAISSGESSNSIELLESDAKCERLPD